MKATTFTAHAQYYGSCA